jgi:hypothetical protein
MGRAARGWARPSRSEAEAARPLRARGTPRRRAGGARRDRAPLVAPPGRHAVAASVQAVSTAPETAYTAVTAVRVPHRG